MTHTYSISGMTCQKCVARVKSALLAIGDVTEADVQLQAPQARITMSKHIPTATLAAAVKTAGKYTLSADDQAQEMDESSSTGNSYYPIFLIFGMITGVTILAQWGDSPFNWMHWMSDFMAAFFLVFAFFKLLNIKGFAEGYQTYDLVARRFPVWGLIYPFVELALGLAFLTGVDLLVTSIITFIVMGISSLGVIQSLLKKKAFQCACLGTVIKLPLSKVTLFEDLLMTAMSAGMAVYMLSN